MGIRTKLALVLSLGIAAATAATACAFWSLQVAALRESEEEKVRLLLDAVRQSARESLVSQDPLVVLDQLATLRRQRPELHHARVLWKGVWHDVGGQAPPDPPGGVRRERVAAAAPDGGAAEVEALLSSRVLEERSRRERQALARNAARAGGAVAALGLLLSALVAGALTRRIVRIERALAEIGEGKLGASVSVGGSDEVSRLARGVSDMSARLQELDRMKKTFVASVTHELRSPLGAIQSQARHALGSAEALPERARAALDRVLRSAERLEHFVASLLEMARIERGQLDFTPRPADLGRIVEDVAAFFEPRAREAGLRLQADVAPGLPPLTLDPDLIAQVATNLVSNAIKFTPAGGAIRVSAGPAGRGAAFEVLDSGIGIPPEALPRLFKPFERAPNAPAGKGTGLGLAIAKSIVDLHRGRITVRSEVGKGTAIRVELPL